MLQHLILTLAILSPFHPVTSAAIIPTPTYDVDPSFNTESPGPIPAEYAILNTTYLNQLDASHGPSNNTSLNLTSSGLLGGRAAPRDNCKGSHYCSWAPWFSAKADHLSCELAYMKFNPNAYYMRYASYTEKHCTAIFNCWPPTTISGYAIQSQFDEIFKNGCKICGEHYFGVHGRPEKTCSVKLDYCYNCNQKGGPTIDHPPYDDDDHDHHRPPIPVPPGVGSVGEVAPVGSAATE